MFGYSAYGVQGVRDGEKPEILKYLQKASPAKWSGHFSSVADM
jgi:hypothetical protein